MTENLPGAFVERMQELLGEEAGLFLASYEDPPVRGLRLNGLKGSLQKLEETCREQFHLEKVPWAEEGFYIAGGEESGEEEQNREEEQSREKEQNGEQEQSVEKEQNRERGQSEKRGQNGEKEQRCGQEKRVARRPGKHPYHEAGLYYLQEPSAMAAVALLDPEPGERVLDLCAAPGGKSTQIAGRMGGRGLLVSNEIHPARAKILSGNMERMGVSGAVVMNEDPEALAARFPCFFDKILIDAPCSGEGMFRKDPEARKEWSPEAVALCAARQKKILGAGVQMLKPGGLLVYSTCTFAPEEDEGSVAYLLEAHPEFTVEHRSIVGFEDLGKGRPGWAQEGAEGKGLEDTYRVWPHKARGEGHYLAALRKAGEDRATEREHAREGRAAECERGGEGVSEDLLKDRKTARRPAEKARSRGVSPDAGTERQKIDLLRSFCREALLARPWEQQPGRYLAFGEQLYYVPLDMPDMDGIKVLRPGLHLGTFKKKRFEPAHALALYLKPEQAKRQVDLPSLSREAERYLRGETLKIREQENGWTLVTVDGYSLGWGKAAGGTLKNHYPKGLRLQG